MTDDDDLGIELYPAPEPARPAPSSIPPPTYTPPPPEPSPRPRRFGCPTEFWAWAVGPACSIILLGVILLVVFLGAVIGRAQKSEPAEAATAPSPPPSPPSPPAPEDYKIEAWGWATDAVRERLKAPSTAKFPWYDPSSVACDANWRYIISSNFEAKNAFGVPLRGLFTCVIWFDQPNHTYHIQSCDVWSP